MYFAGTSLPLHPLRRLETLLGGFVFPQRGILPARRGGIRDS